MKNIINLLLMLCSVTALSAMEDSGFVAEKHNGQIINLINQTGYTLKLTITKEVSRGADGGWAVKEKKRQLDKGETFKLQASRTKSGKAMELKKVTVCYSNVHFDFMREIIELPLALINLESQDHDITVGLKASGIGDHNIVVDLSDMSIDQELPSQLKRLVVANETINYNMFIRYTSRRETEDKTASQTINRYPIEKSVITILTPGEEYPVVIAKESVSGDDYKQITKKTAATKIEIALASDNHQTNNYALANSSSITGWVELPISRIKRIAYDSEAARFPITKNSNLFDLFTKLGVDLKEIQKYTK